MTASSIIAGSYLGRVVIARHAPAHIPGCLYDEDGSGVLALAAWGCAVVGRFGYEAENRPPIVKRGSDFLRFAKHALNAIGSQGERPLLRGAVWAILPSRRAEPVHNPMLYSAQQFVRGLPFDTAQRPREIEIGTAHEAKGQTCRGFIRDRSHISHGAFPTKHAPQNACSIYRPIRIVNTAFDKSPRAAFRTMYGRQFDIGQSSRALAVEPTLGARTKRRAPASKGGGVNARVSTIRYASIQSVSGMRRTPHGLYIASILPCQDRDQNRRGPNKEHDSQPQQDLRYKVGHQSPLDNLSFPKISERFQLQYLRAEVSASAIYRAISLAIADHGPLFANSGAAA